MPRQRVLAIGLAAIWGACATWMFWWLIPPVYAVLFSASQPALKGLLQNGVTGEQIKPYFHGILTVLAAFFYGSIFGIPLGILVRRSVIPTWVAFVITFVVVLFVRMLLAPLDVLTAVENFMSSLYLLTFLATLLFAFASNRVRLAYDNQRAAA
jgi:hypothetical protein